MQDDDLFATLLAQAGEVRQHQVSDASNATYISYLKSYEECMTTEFHKDPYPLSEDKMTVFLMKKKADGRTFASLKLWCATFSWYFRREGLPNLAMSLSFKQFTSGLKRLMTGAKFPHQKQPFLIEFFGPLHEKMDVNTAEDRLLFFLMCLSFHFFMRVGEITSLKVKNVQVNREKSLLSCTFERSKADQFGVGVTSYIPITDSLSNPVKYIDIISQKDPEERLCPWSSHSLISRLRKRLELIGVENPTAYSWHSFRRGAAFLASRKGVQDCVIKKHGRWASDAYIRYVSVEAVRAGREVYTSLTE